MVRIYAARLCSAHLALKFPAETLPIMMSCYDSSNILASDTDILRYTKYITIYIMILGSVVCVNNISFWDFGIYRNRWRVVRLYRRTTVNKTLRSYTRLVVVRARRIISSSSGISNIRCVLLFSTAVFPFTVRTFRRTVITVQCKLHLCSVSRCRFLVVLLVRYCHSVFLFTDNGRRPLHQPLYKYQRNRII